MSADCTCFPTPVEQQFKYYGATEPGSALEYNPECPEHGRSGPETPRANPRGVIPSAEGHGAASDALSVQKPDFPSMWWSPSEAQWFADIPGEGLMAFGSLGSLADGLPKDARRLVPAGPLLALLPELDQLATEAGSFSEEAEVWVRSATDRLCARLASLLGESPESHAQEGTQ